MQKKRHRKTVHDCYFMDLFACGFETRSFAPQTVSPRRQISSHEITQSFPMFCSCRFFAFLLLSCSYRIKNLRVLYSKSIGGCTRSSIMDFSTMSMKGFWFSCMAWITAFFSFTGTCSRGQVDTDRAATPIACS